LRASAAVTRGWRHLFVLIGLAAAVTGCGTGSRMVRAVSVSEPVVEVPSAAAAFAAPADTAAAVEFVDLVTPPPGSEPEAIVLVSTERLGFEVADDTDRAPSVLAQARLVQAPAGAQPERDEYDVEEYDPWEPFNETMFEFNRKLDRYVLKPAATGYDTVVPDDVQRMIANAFDNLGAPRRMVNSLLQRKWDGAMRELARFMVNTTVGVGGLFDMGRAAEIEKSREDFGQTLGFYGVGPGPYLVLPLMEPLTVRDGIGKFVDGWLEPLGYFIPFFWEGLVVRIEEIVNERSLNLELFQGFEETVVDMYSAVRHAYLERRRNLIRE
jgi:phospholipid-binding lipoprotein MlaA